MLEINDTEEINEVNFPTYLKIIKNIKGNYPAYCLNIKRVRAKQALFVEELIYILTL